MRGPTLSKPAKIVKFLFILRQISTVLTDQNYILDIDVLLLKFYFFVTTEQFVIVRGVYTRGGWCEMHHRENWGGRML